MKRFLVVLFAFVFLLLCSMNAMAQVECMGDGNATTDSWYTVDPKEPYLEAYINTYDSSSSEVGLEYFENDHSFFDIGFSDSATLIAGSFLSEDVGFFLGGKYINYTDLDFSILYMSPGVRMSLDESGYIAFSYNYISIFDDWYTETGSSFDVKFKYFIEDQSKFTGKISIPDTGDPYFYGGANFKAFEKMVIGCSFQIEGDLNTYDVGLTWDLSGLIIDAELGKSFYYDYYGDTIVDNFYSVSGMFKLGESFKLGASYFKWIDTVQDGAILLKVKYTVDNSSFVFRYRPENDSYSTFMSGAFEMGF